MTEFITMYLIPRFLCSRLDSRQQFKSPVEASLSQHAHDVTYCWESRTHARTPHRIVGTVVLCHTSDALLMFNSTIDAANDEDTVVCFSYNSNTAL